MPVGAMPHCDDAKAGEKADAAAAAPDGQDRIRHSVLTFTVLLVDNHTLCSTVPYLVP